MSFGKIFECTFTGSMYGKGADIFAVWAYVIAHTRPPGLVELNSILVAAQLGTTVDAVEKALTYLQAEDPRSRTADCDGKRLVKVGQYLYEVPAWNKYRGMRDDEERRTYDRLYKRKTRAQAKLSIQMSKMSTGVHHSLPSSTQAEAEAEAEADNTKTGGSVPSPVSFEEFPFLNTVEFKLAWGEYLVFRKEKKQKPLPPKSIKANFTKFSKWGHDAAILSIRTTIERGWTGFFEPKPEPPSTTQLPLLQTYKTIN